MERAIPVSLHKGKPVGPPQRNHGSQGHNRPPQRPKTFGVSAVDFYTRLRDKNVHIIFRSGRTLEGFLEGVDIFDLIVSVADDLGTRQLVLVPKSAIETTREGKE